MRIANFGKNIQLFLAFVFLFSFGINFAFAQLKENKSNIECEDEINSRKTNRDSKSNWKTLQVAKNLSGTPAEKSIAVDEKIKLQFCVSEGNVKVTGWDRNEVRVFINEGSQIGFNIIQSREKTKKPVWIAALGYEPSKDKGKRVDECLSGDDIEIEVPHNATVNIKSRSSKTKIDSVRKVNIKNIGGGIFLNNIAEGIEAATYEGDVTVEKSSGAITLESVSGNILAFDVHAGEIGDVFKAKTSSGLISLQDIGHRQLEIETNSGSIKFNGAFAEGGQYGFGTTNGAIKLIIPPDSSCKISASYGFGVFASELPLKNVVKSQSTSVKNLSATLGDGDCTLYLRTYNGAILLAKDEEK